MQIDVKILKFFLLYGICHYGIEKKVALKRNMKNHLSIHSKVNSKPKYILVGQNNIRPYSCHP